MYYRYGTVCLSGRRVWCEKAVAGVRVSTFDNSHPAAGGRQRLRGRGGWRVAGQGGRDMMDVWGSGTTRADCVVLLVLGSTSVHGSWRGNTAALQLRKLSCPKGCRTRISILVAEPGISMQPQLPLSWFAPSSTHAYDTRPAGISKA